MIAVEVSFLWKEASWFWCDGTGINGSCLALHDRSKEGLGSRERGKCK
jgi:hypothetical protein